MSMRRSSSGSLMTASPSKLTIHALYSQYSVIQVQLNRFTLTPPESPDSTLHLQWNPQLEISRMNDDSWVLTRLHRWFLLLNEGPECCRPKHLNLEYSSPKRSVKFSALCIIWRHFPQPNHLRSILDAKPLPQDKRLGFLDVGPRSCQRRYT